MSENENVRRGEGMAAEEESVNLLIIHSPQVLSPLLTPLSVSGEKKNSSKVQEERDKQI